MVRVGAKFGRKSCTHFLYFQKNIMKDIVKGSPFLKEELLLTLAGEVDYPKFLTNLFAKPFAHDYKY